MISIVWFCNFYLDGQYVKTASCSNLNFDKKVDGYLSYSAPVISVSEAFKNQSEYLFLDARELNEYQISHIPDARFVGYDDFNLQNLADLPKDRRIIVYCSIGYRSEKIATKLKKQGYKYVYNLYGSIFEWVNMGYDVDDKNGQPVKKIHTYNKKWGQWVFNPDLEKIW
ncbi:MAG: rhodanese-like domain-containing protein [Saprospiraceae bacterium]|nr:rhodanese-like domain-containing protein [Saprospiraceae bacterium]